MSRLVILFFAAVLLFQITGCDKKSKAPTPVPASVTIKGKTWNVETASTDDQRNRGFGGWKYISEDQGMLFVFPYSDNRTFCMRDCYVPIDIAFIDSNMIIVNIHTMLVEADRAGVRIYRSDKPAQYVLEVQGGLFAKVGVKEGDKVTFSGDIPEGR